jgi:CMP/dCMP kinase
MAHHTSIVLKTTPASTLVFIDEPPRDISKQIRTNPLVTKYVSPMVASIPEIRKEIQIKQQTMAGDTTNTRGVVMDGRDTGTVVFPNAQLKIFLTCPAEIRAKRRLLELGGEETLTDPEKLRKTVQELVERDEADYRRRYGPMQKADDAVEIDTGNMTLEGQIELILKLAKERGCQV